MSERKNLKIEVDTYERLREEKGQYETWDGMLNRVVDELDAEKQAAQIISRLDGERVEELDTDELGRLIFEDMRGGEDASDVVERWAKGKYIEENIND